MENIIGVIAFIVFIALRALGDRKKGMYKEPAKKVVQPQKVINIDLPIKRIKLERQPLEPAFAPIFKTEPTRLVYQEQEGRKDTNNPVYLEGAELENEAIVAIPFPELDQENEDYHYAYEHVKLQEAVIWSEILRKPKFYGTHGHYYKHIR